MEPLGGKWGDKVPKSSRTRTAEVSAHPLLEKPMAALLDPAKPSICVPSLRRGVDDAQRMLTSLGQLHVRGQSIDQEPGDRVAHRVGARAAGS